MLCSVMSRGKGAKNLWIHSNCFVNTQAAQGRYDQHFNPEPWVRVSVSDETPR